jgi:hypothetical protein
MRKLIATVLMLALFGSLIGGVCAAEGGISLSDGKGMPGDTVYLAVKLSGAAYGSSIGIAAESIAGLRDAGIHPILFGEDMPCIDARICGKESATDDYTDGDAKLAYLLGIAPHSDPSPMTRICAMLKTVQQLTSFSKNV